MTFAEKFLKLRKQASLSQEDTAEKLGVSRQAISRWEQGTALPDAFNLSIISKVFGVSADYLIDDGLTTVLSSAVRHDENSADAAMQKALFVAEDRACKMPVSVCKYIHFAALAFETAAMICFVCSQVAAFWLLFGIGVLISVMSLITVESLLGGKDGALRSKYRRRYYRFSVWVAVPLPLIVLVISICWLFMSNSGSTMPVFLISFCCLAVHVFASAVISAALSDRN